MAVAAADVNVRTRRRPMARNWVRKYFRLGRWWIPSRNEIQTRDEHA